jgi:hypothetical protein
MKAALLVVLAALTTCTDKETRTEVEIGGEGIAYVRNF